MTKAIGKTASVSAALIIQACGISGPRCTPGPEIECFQGMEVVAREVLIEFAAGTPPDVIIDVRAAEDIDYEKSIGDVLQWHSATKDVATLMRDLSTRSDVEHVAPNYNMRAL
jgi:hypothetical protein